MSANLEAMRHLAKSVMSCLLLSVCSFGSRAWEGKIEKMTKSEKNENSVRVQQSDSVTEAVRWASVVVLLSAAYYLQFQIWRRFWQRKRDRNLRVLRRSQYRQTNTASSGSLDGSSRGSGNSDLSTEDVDLDSLPPVGEDEVWIEGTSVVSNNVYYPELTMSSVWTYVYGWGILLFVCIYCLAGANIPSSCWWVMGMIALSFDELISKGVGKWFICLMGVCLCGSVFSVWSGALMDDNGNFVGDLMFTTKGSIPLLDFIMGVVFPVSTPFIFFSIRSTVRSVTRDVAKLCEFALPFMTVLAVCFLVATSGVCEAVDANNVGQSFSSKAASHMLDTHGSDRRRVESRSHHDFNASHEIMAESVAKFAGPYATHLNGHNATLYLESSVVRYSLLAISPFIAFWLIRVLIIAILTGHSTEFITAFILVTSARYGITHVLSLWSVIALSGAGFAFVLLLLVRRH
jgi:hypothetical protein